jgi:chromosome partitioning protein
VREALGSYPVPVLQATVSQRVVFAEAVAHGLAVYEADPSGVAAAEIELLVNELMEVSK